MLTTWQRRGAAAAPATARDLAEAETRLGRPVPDPLRALLSVANGVSTGTGALHDGDLTRFWPTTELVWAESWGAEDRGILLFADFLLCSYAYGVRVDDPGAGEIVIVGGARPERVASSLDEWLDRYLRAPMGDVQGDE